MLKDIIKKVLREQLEDKPNLLKDKIKKLTDEVGVSRAAKYVGGVDKYIDIMFGGDLAKFAKENNIQLARISQDGLNLYFNNLLVELLDLPKAYNKDEKELGKFHYGPKNSVQYSFTARLRKVTFADGRTEWRVVGTSGDSGFGYGYINSRNILGKRYRNQIYKQIIERYGLEKYM